GGGPPRSATWASSSRTRADKSRIICRLWSNFCSRRVTRSSSAVALCTASGCARAIPSSAASQLRVRLARGLLGRYMDLLPHGEAEVAWLPKPSGDRLAEHTLLVEVNDS